MVYRLAGAAESDKLVKAGLRKKAPKTSREGRSVKDTNRISKISSSNLNEHDDEVAIDKTKLNTDHDIYEDTKILFNQERSRDFDSSNDKINPKNDFKKCI